MTNEERPNWVEARANCTLEGTFEQLIAAIRHDVKCFNNLYPDKRVLPAVKDDRIDNTVNFGGDLPTGIH